MQGNLAPVSAEEKGALRDPQSRKVCCQAAGCYLNHNLRFLLFISSGSFSPLRLLPGFRTAGLDVLCYGLALSPYLDVY